MLRIRTILIHHRDHTVLIGVRLDPQHKIEVGPFVLGHFGGESVVQMEGIYLDEFQVQDLGGLDVDRLFGHFVLAGI